MNGQVQTQSLIEPVAPEQLSTIRCVAVIDQTLPPGLAANAAGVLALTLGAMLPGLVGADLIDADGVIHPGLIPHGLPILAARTQQLSELRTAARKKESVGVIDFPADGQLTTNYEEFRQRVSTIPADELEYLGLLLYGPRRAISKLTGNLSLLR